MVSRSMCVGFTAVLFTGGALGGEPVYAINKDLGLALEKATAAVEDAAKKHGTCVSEYPSLDTCVIHDRFNDYFQCRGIRANHLGSCPNKPSDLDNVIKAVTGLSRAAAAAKLGAQ